VIDVVSKTGRADIASDPMGVEVSDVIVTLKPREEWTTAKSKDDLVDKMRAELAALPGVASSFSQPIALRVDELVSGVKSAIGIPRARRRSAGKWRSGGSPPLRNLIQNIALLSF